MQDCGTKKETVGNACIIFGNGEYLSRQGVGGLDRGKELGCMATLFTRAIA